MELDRNMILGDNNLQPEERARESFSLSGTYRGSLIKILNAKLMFSFCSSKS